MKQTTQTITFTFALIPRVGCVISANGVVVETVPVIGHTARLAELGYKAANVSRYGHAATGRAVTKRGK